MSESKLGLCRPIRGSILQSAPAGAHFHGRGHSLRQGSFPPSDSARSHEVDLEAGVSAANRGGVAETSASSEASAHERDMGTRPSTANRGGPAGTSAPSEASEAVQPGIRHGMVLPFQPVTLTFRDVHYSVDLPAVRYSAGVSLPWARQPS